jgi:hypothetical protein
MWPGILRVPPVWRLLVWSSGIVNSGFKHSTNNHERSTKWDSKSEGKIVSAVVYKWCVWCYGMSNKWTLLNPCHHWVGSFKALAQHVGCVHNVSPHKLHVTCCRYITYHAKIFPWVILCFLFPRMNELIETAGVSKFCQRTKLQHVTLNGASVVLT